MSIASKVSSNLIDMKLTPIRILTLAAAAAGCQASFALELPDQLGDHAVLQQQSDAKLWGWAKPGAEITASPSWSKKTVKTKADASGRWSLSVATLAASYQPYSIKFTEGKESLTINDILIGEVWLAAGQSNMEMPMRGFNSQPVEGAGADVARSGALRDKVRMAYVVRGDKYEPQERIGGKWMVSSPENTAEFSAQGFYFARELNELIDVPVGILCVSYGGTQIEGWLPRDILERYGYNPDAEPEIKELAPAYFYTTKYYSMLYPLIGYTIKGFLWNQGESNILNPDNYAQLLTEMVARWRSDWGDKDNSLSFYQTENPPFGWFNPGGLPAALVREQQNKAVDMIPNSGITCTNDLVYPYETDVIHGTKKREIGERMAWQVAERDYGVKGMTWRCPAYESHTIADDGTARVRFKDTAFGLVPNCGNVEGFEVAGDDGVFHVAQAKVDWNNPEVILSCPEVKDIKNIRYCFKNFEIGGLRNSWGMPAIPFRTDELKQ